MTRLRCALPAGLFFLALLILWGCSSARAQTRLVVIEYADVSSAEPDGDFGTVRRLSGNVRLRSDTTALSADRVVYYESRGEVVLDGRVRIISGGDTLTSTRATYDANTREATATGRVRLGDGESALYAPTVRYNTREEIAAFSGGGRLLHRGAALTAPSGTYSTARRFAQAEGPVTLVDSSGTLTAARGTYDANVQRADFVGEVRLRRTDANLDADSLVYFRRTERARAFGEAVLERFGGAREVSRVDPGRLDPDAAPDRGQRTLLFGASLAYDGQAETAEARGTPARDPLLVLIRTDSTGRADTTVVRAERLDAVQVEVSAQAAAEAFEAFGGGSEASPEGFEGPDEGVDTPDDEAEASGRVAEPSAEGREASPPRAAPLPPRAGPPAQASAPLEQASGASSQAFEASSPVRQQTLRAVGRVRLTQPRMAASADSVVFVRLEADDVPTRDALALHGATRPSVWYDGAQLTGERLFAWATGEALDSVRVVGTAFSARLDSTLGRVQQIRGPQMLALFRDERIRTLSVWPQAEALTFRADDAGLFAGADQLSADSLVFRFEEGDLREVGGIRGVEGTSYGPSSTPEGLRLDGYAFSPSRRPRAEVLLDPEGWEARWLQARALQDGPARPPTPPTEPSAPEPPPELPPAAALSAPRPSDP